MLYVVYGKEEFLIDNKIKEIVLDNDVIYYDLNFDNLDDILYDASMVSLLSLNKYIVINNPYFLSQATAGVPVIDTVKLEQYVLNMNPNTFLIFKYVKENVLESKKITKLLRSKGTFYDLNKFNVINFIKEQFGDFSIDNATINLLVDRVGDNISVLKEEIEKLKIYKYDEKCIDKDDVNELNENVEVDFFKFIDHIINRDKREALEEYLTLIDRKEEPIKILIVLANKIRLMYQTKILGLKGYTTNDIAKMLDVHPYAVQKTQLCCKNYSDEKLLNTLAELCFLDEDMKNGKQSPSTALEMFIINL